MPQSVVSPLTCSSPTNSVRTFVLRTQASPSVKSDVLGERRKALSDKQRTPYEQKAVADKKRYEDEKAAYNAQGDDDEDED